MNDHLGRDHSKADRSPQDFTIKCNLGMNLIAAHNHSLMRPSGWQLLNLVVS